MASNKYEEIVLAAVKLFDKKGYHATSVQDIADAVGLQKGSLYHYISGKADLLLGVAQRAITEFNLRMERILASKESAQSKMKKALEMHLQLVTHDVQLSTVLLRESVALGENPQQVIQDATDQYLDLWTRLIEEGMAGGEFRPGNARMKALAVLGACNWVYRWYQEDGALTSEMVADIYADLFLDGIANSK
ncbi:TetR family transcriptional regulator [Tumebacillus algifaecis]|uniref:TetR family transcriptional regulator n=1 Tax=Tumebacillus algifaecis TaxID=1214604 RepID=A0A223D5T8_9BACL|nr:TetR/AcrR family transcriptional regulator [Tumebacillus algifaecis]ASS76959.1 TetR family transcriptional regulator [Tumebacillus algifaecis]